MTRTVARYKRKQHKCVPGAQQELAAFIAQRRALVEEIHSVSATFCSILYHFILMTTVRLGKNSILGLIQFLTMLVTAADVISMNFSLFPPVLGLFVALSLFSLSFPTRKRTARLSSCLSIFAPFVVSSVSVSSPISVSNYLYYIFVLATRKVDVAVKFLYFYNLR
jgi:hypothetical protein